MTTGEIILEKSQEKTCDASKIFGDISINNNTINQVITNFTNLLELQEDPNDIVDRIFDQQNSLEKLFNDRYQKIIPTCFDVNSESLITVFRLSGRFPGAGDSYPFINGKAFIVKDNEFLELNFGEFGKINGSESYIEDYESNPQDPDIKGILFDEFDYFANIKKNEIKYL